MPVKKTYSLRLPGAYLGLGVLACQNGSLSEARRLFQIAGRIEPNCPEAYGGQAIVHHQQGDYQAAFEMYLKWLELDGENLTALLGLFQTSRQMGTFAKIIHYLEIYLAKHPDDGSVLFCLASLYAREGKLSQARQRLREVLAIEPEKAEAQKLLAEVESRLARAPMQEVTDA